MTMKKHLIALPLVALAAIGMTGCTAVVVPDEPQATVTLAPKDTSAQPSQSSEQGWQTQAPETGAETSAPTETGSAAPSQEAGTTIDLGSDGATGTVYLEAVQAFSPYMSKYVIDGDTVHYSKFTCVGEDKGARVKGTLTPWSTDKKQMEIKWSGNTDLDTGPFLVTDQAMETTLITGDDVAFSDLEAQKNTFSAMCLETGDAIASIVQ